MKIILPGYVPPSQNALKGSHWSEEYQQKKRAYHALYSTVAIATGSISTSGPCNLVIGTTTELNTCKTGLSNLGFYLGTLSNYSKGLSPRIRQIVSKMKEQKSL